MRANGRANGGGRLPEWRRRSTRMSYPSSPA